MKITLLTLWTQVSLPCTQVSMNMMVGECPVYDEGNMNVRRTVCELLNEGDLERRILKTGILMTDVKRSAQCDKYDPEAETCKNAGIRTAGGGTSSSQPSGSTSSSPRPSPG